MTCLSQNVLVIEDNPGDIFLIQNLLGSSLESGFSLLSTDNLNHAKDLLSQHHISIVLLDLGLPESQGLETLQNVQYIAPNTPIVILTGLDDELLAIQALHSGAQDYLVKGQINRTWLISTLNHSIKRSQMLRALHEREMVLTTSNHMLQQEVADKTTQLSQTHQQLHQYQTLVNLDSLTNLANRRHFNIRLQRDWQISLENNTCLSLLMIDLDEFKQFNDAYGHPQGDICLQKVAKAIQAALKYPDDLAARYGGEEVVVLLPDTSSHGAITVAERILIYVRGLAIPHQRSRVSPTVSVSIGIAVETPELTTNAQTLVDRADQSLYLSKQSGRNQWSLAPSYSLALD